MRVKPNMTNTIVIPKYCSPVNDSWKIARSAMNWNIVYVNAKGCNLETWLR